ncbi:polyprenal reductase-like [Littorina saxatilis]|uniref:Polyprenal reductase n=1 Tax=Littorina saxatilis TaxID=31220 RepID=A0AAN9G674_9CAEN
MDVSIQSGFWLVSSAALVLAYFLDQHPAVPNLWRSIFRWGKMRVGVLKEPKQFYEVPKRWFQHFYPVGVAVNFLLLVLLIQKVFFGEQWPPLLRSVLQQLQHPVSFTDITRAEPVMLVLAMELMQVCRRSYETFCVHVFSEKATMTLLHYLLGYVYYLVVGPCILAGTNFQHLRLSDSISAYDWAVYGSGLLMFVSASVMQHKSFRILAALRTDVKGKDKQHQYLLPKGGLFDKVSCPHFLAEIIIYFSFCVVFRFQHTVILSLFVFVLVNQVIAALITYQWYCKNFPGYSEKRYAVFPFLL